MELREISRERYGQPGMTSGRLLLRKCRDKCVRRPVQRGGNLYTAEEAGEIPLPASVARMRQPDGSCGAQAGRDGSRPWIRRWRWHRRFGTI